MLSMNVVLIWVRTHEVMRPTTATICDPGTFQVNFYCYPYARMRSKPVPWRENTNDHNTSQSQHISNRPAILPSA